MKASAKRWRVGRSPFSRNTVRTSRHGQPDGAERTAVFAPAGIFCPVSVETTNCRRSMAQYATCVRPSPGCYSFQLEQTNEITDLEQRVVLIGMADVKAVMPFGVIDGSPAFL